ncbi:MAG TPA: hypothetical protein VEJ84_02950 [Acidimicrobiales bacterium]|nr:hypothetical protein [Acidimicrobiales bacterium]
MTEQALQTLDDVRELAQQLRVDSVRCSSSAGPGHPTSSMSAADVMAVLLARHLRYDWQRPDDPTNHHLTAGISVAHIIEAANALVAHLGRPGTGGTQQGPVVVSPGTGGRGAGPLPLGWGGNRHR